MLPFSVITHAIALAVYGLPLAAIAAVSAALPGPAAPLLWLAAAPLVYPTLFVLIAAVISRPFQRSIVPGKSPRDVQHPVYRVRRIYGLCWTCVYYNKPVYFLALTLPWLRTVMFRGFGYRGSLDFTIYPDTWIRDLPLLDFGPGAYVANRATLGTNMALSDGTSFVDRIVVGARATVSHLVVLAPGVTVGARAEVGATSVVGIRVAIGDRVNVQPHATVNHAARIGDGATVGTAAYVGAAAVVEAGAHVAAAGNVPNRSRVASTPSTPGQVESQAS
jgi:carbonic anhydrase/acetyltransferase-like protein (isoleucine patch superfamily)